VDAELKATGGAKSVPPFPGHDGGEWAPVPSQVVAAWPAGTLAENLAVDAAGAVFVSLHTHRRIDRYEPAGGSVECFCELPAPVAGLAFSREGTLWASGGTVGEPPGFVWRVTAGGAFEEWLQIPDALFLNGCALHPDGRTLLVCESITGRILAVDLLERRWTAWIGDELLRPVNQQIPGANGIKLHDGHAWVSVTDRNLILRAPAGALGGPLEVAAERLRADDFAFARSGAVYVATHPAHSVLRLAPDGSRLTLAGPAEGAVGSTACAFGCASGDEHALYVTTSGGLLIPYRGTVEEAKLVRLEVGEPGKPVPAG
jgi:sugar lactone lactonase YvrE